ncbi:hypothetical protein G3A39_44645, partial [Paraburkholderia aspalathi]|nr:hypothetical protein [Paraburkholderia aspalathi]
THVFGPLWQRPLASHLFEVHGHSISHSAFSHWKYLDVSRDTLLVVLQLFSQEAFDRIDDMEAALEGFLAQLEEWKALFPATKPAVLMRKSELSAFSRFLPLADCELTMAA